MVSTTRLAVHCVALLGVYIRAHMLYADVLLFGVLALYSKYRK
jgi:hypothetical protein